MHNARWLGIMWLMLILAGCSSGQEVEFLGETAAGTPGTNATAEAILQQMAAQGASATAEASTTSTAIVDYGADVAAARQTWADAAVANYTWEYTHNNPAVQGFQSFTVTVRDGQVTEVKHDCAPAEFCLRLKVDDEQTLRVDGVLDTLTNLAEEQYPVILVRFNSEYGFPEVFAGNSDESPYYIEWRTIKFTVDE